MHTLKVLSISFALIFCISMLYGCGSDGNNGDLSMFLPVTSESQSDHRPEYISLFGDRLDSLDLDHSAGSTTIQIRANCDWSISFRESSDNKETKEIDWIKAEPSSGTGDCEVTLTFEDNKTMVFEYVLVHPDTGTGYGDDGWLFGTIKDRFCDLVVTSESGTTSIATLPIKQEGVTVNNARRGDKIQFGRYPQSADADINDPNTYEPLTWIVTRKEYRDKGRLYLTPEKVIDNQEMDINMLHNGDFTIKSKLYKFFQGDFYNKAFNDEEHEAMQWVSGMSSVDLLDQNNFYYDFDTPESRCCKPTDYAIANGISVSDNGYSPYWYEYYSSPIGYHSAIGSDGNRFDKSVPDKLGLRPEIVISFKAAGI